MSSEDQQRIEEAWEKRQSIDPDSVPAELRQAVERTLDRLETGELRVAEPASQGWQIHGWIKQAILMYFRIRPMRVIDGAPSAAYDKVPLRFANDDHTLTSCGARVVPPATVRRGAFVGSDVVLMPSYVNIGAYVGAGSMVDTWATIGSCAQIGNNVHISGGAGIGGVLEPLQAAPCIVEDGAFIGARSEIVEGVRVGHGAVIGMGVFIGQSTRIFDRASGEILRGEVPPGAVVVPGSLPAADRSHSLACAVIVKTVDERTRAKTSINELLRS